MAVDGTKVAEAELLKDDSTTHKSFCGFLCLTDNVPWRPYHRSVLLNLPHGRGGVVGGVCSNFMEVGGYGADIFIYGTIRCR